MEPKWKYAKPKIQSKYEDYYKPDYNKKMKLVLKDIVFIKKPIDEVDRTILQSDIVQANDEKMDKVFTVFNYDNIVLLKKKLGIKRCKAEIELIRKYDKDTMEDHYDILSVKKLRN